MRFKKPKCYIRPNNAKRRFPGIQCGSSHTCSKDGLPFEFLLSPERDRHGADLRGSDKDHGLDRPGPVVMDTRGNATIDHASEARDDAPLFRFDRKQSRCEPNRYQERGQPKHGRLFSKNNASLSVVFRLVHLGAPSKEVQGLPYPLFGAISWNRAGIGAIVAPAPRPRRPQGPLHRSPRSGVNRLGSSASDRPPRRQTPGPPGRCRDY